MFRLLKVTKFPVLLFSRYLGLTKLLFKPSEDKFRNFGSEPIRIRKLTPKDVGKAMKFVRDKFPTNEPLVKGLNMDQNALSPSLVEFLRNEIDHGMTYTAAPSRKTDLTQSFGMVINTNIVPWDPFLWNNFSTCIKCSRTKDLITLWSFLVKDSEIFNKYDTGKIFNVAHVIVSEENSKAFHPELNAHNLCCILVDKSLKIANFRGYSVAFMLCSGYNLSKVAEDCGMNLIYDFPYNKLLNEDLTPVVKTIEPNSNVKIYIKKLLKD